MSLLSTWAFMVYLLISSSLAQNTTQPTCADIGNLLRYNASTSHQMSGFSISGSRNPADPSSPDQERRFSVNNDSSRTWTLSLFVHRREDYKPSSGSDRAYQQTLILDTVDSNVTQLGVCHHVVAPEGIGFGYQWTKKVMERSLKDTGDCRTMLGDKCANALIEHYRQDAALNSLRGGSCEKVNNTVPRECAGMVQPRTQSMNMTEGLASYIPDRPSNSTTTLDPSKNCVGLNVTTNHVARPVPGITFAAGVNYDASIRFPLVDVVTFWPNRSSGFQSYTTSWIEDVQVRLVCLRPDQVVKGGGDVPPSGEDMLNRQGALFRSIPGEDALSDFSTSDTVTLRHGALAWVSMAVICMILIL